MQSHTRVHPGPACPAASPDVCAHVVLVLYTHVHARGLPAQRQDGAQPDRVLLFPSGRLGTMGAVLGDRGAPGAGWGGGMSALCRMGQQLLGRVGGCRVLGSDMAMLG